MPSLSTSPAPPLQEGTPAGQISLWEAAYLRYETPEEEIRKFMGRLKRLGAREWPVEARIVELFCGRGNGLRALGRLGFRNLEAVDLSPRLIAQFQGAATRYVADCRHLPFAGASKDVVIVQGGLHHLPVLPGDLQQTFAEIRRVLKPEGRVMFVEPWRTPFLNFAHWLWENPVLRRLSSKLDALATMTENERTTYERWLSVPEMITGMAHEHFEPLREFFAWGKWNFLGRPRPK